MQFMALKATVTQPPLLLLMLLLPINIIVKEAV